MSQITFIPKSSTPTDLPSSGEVTVYFKSDKALYGLDSSGNEFLIGVSGSSNFKGVWDASTNTPTLSDSVGDVGDEYLVTTAGSIDLGSGVIDFSLKDKVIYANNRWYKLDNVDDVTSVFNRKGDIIPETGDYSANQISSSPAGNLVADNVQDALNELDTEKQSTSEKGQANGYASLDASGQVPAAQLPISSYVHPDHTGDVTSNSDGATTITDGAVTTPKIADNAVTLDKIEDGTADQVLTTDGAGNPQYSDTENAEDPAFSALFTKVNGMGFWLPSGMMYRSYSDASIGTGQTDASIFSATSYKSQSGAQPNSTTDYFFPAGSLKAGQKYKVRLLIDETRSPTDSNLAQDMKLQLGGTTLLSFDTNEVLASGVDIWLEFQVVSEGASGSVRARYFSESGQHYESPVTIDTTVDNELDVVITTLSASSAVFPEIEILFA